jgi:hypothetical protein
VNHRSRSILDSYGTIETTDADGRSLTVRPPDAIDKLRLFKAVGPELGRNPLYLGMAVVAFSITAIDGVPVPRPTNEHQIETLITRLGNNGLDAVRTIVERDPTDAEVREEAGNSAGTPT